MNSNRRSHTQIFAKSKTIRFSQIADNETMLNFAIPSLSYVTVERGIRV